MQSSAISLNYLFNKPKNINWVVIAGNRKLSVLEDHDVIFDQKDLDIRKLNINFKDLK